MKEARKAIFANTVRKLARGESVDKEEIVEEELVLLVRAVKAVQEYTKNVDVDHKTTVWRSIGFARIIYGTTRPEGAMSLLSKLEQADVMEDVNYHALTDKEKMLLQTDRVTPSVCEQKQENNWLTLRVEDAATYRT